MVIFHDGLYGDFIGAPSKISRSPIVLSSLGLPCGFFNTYTCLIIFAYLGFHACFYLFILLYVRTYIQIGKSFRQRPIDNHIFTPNFWSL